MKTREIVPGSTVAFATTAVVLSFAGTYTGLNNMYEYDHIWAYPPCPLLSIVVLMSYPEMIRSWVRREPLKRGTHLGIVDLPGLMMALLTGVVVAASCFMTGYWIVGTLGVVVAAWAAGLSLKPLKAWWNK